jgi:hypothetical protein
MMNDRDGLGSAFVTILSGALRRLKCFVFERDFEVLKLEKREKRFTTRINRRNV